MPNGTYFGEAPPVQSGLERLRNLWRTVPRAVPLARDIQAGIEGGYQAPPGFPRLEEPAISAFQRQLRGEVGPREQAEFVRPALERFRSMTGQIADAGLAAGRQYIPSDYATAVGGVPSQELATGLGQAQVGLERLRTERQARALQTLGRYIPQVMAGREAFGGLVGEAARGVPGPGGIPAGVDPAAWRTNLYNIRAGRQIPGGPVGGYSVRRSF